MAVRLILAWVLQEGLRFVPASRQPTRCARFGRRTFHTEPTRARISPIQKILLEWTVHLGIRGHGRRCSTHFDGERSDSRAVGAEMGPRGSDLYVFRAGHRDHAYLHHKRRDSPFDREGGPLVPLGGVGV